MGEEIKWGENFPEAKKNIHSWRKISGEWDRNAERIEAEHAGAHGHMTLCYSLSVASRSKQFLMCSQTKSSHKREPEEGHQNNKSKLCVCGQPIVCSREEEKTSKPTATHREKSTRPKQKERTDHYLY